MKLVDQRSDVILCVGDQPGKGIRQGQASGMGRTTAEQSFRVWPAMIPAGWPGPRMHRRREVPGRDIRIDCR